MGVRKLNFGVVTLTVTTLAVGGFVVKLSQPYLPRPELNAVDSFQSDYIAAGAGQNIPWRKLDADTFAEARRQEKPVAVVLGASWSRDGRTADREIFTDEDVAATLRRNFVCARVDVEAQPFWLNALLPLSRVGTDAGPGFQVAYFTPQGNLYEFRTLRRTVGLNPDDFRQELQNARRLYDDLPSPMPRELKIQTVDLDILMERANPGLPDPRPMLEFLEESIPPTGGFGAQPTQLLRSSNWRFLLLGGRTEAFRRSFDPVLGSGIVDWLCGGFFRRSRRTPWQDVDFDKLSIKNADMMLLSLEAFCVLNEPRYREIATLTFDSFPSEMTQNGLIATARIGSEDRRGRSVHFSFSYNEVNTVWGGTVLNREDSRWAAKNLSLDPARNPQMVIQVPNLGVERDPRFIEVMTKLREAREGKFEPEATQVANAVANCRSAAAMLLTARLLDDPVRMKVAEKARDRAELFRNGDDVSHTLDASLDAIPYLGDYLAYAEMALADFLASGRTKSLEDGAVVLDRALTLFASGKPGIFLDIPKSQAPAGPVDIAVPEILDHLSESNVARLIRLGSSYGRLLQDGPMKQSARRFQRAASDAGDSFGGLGSQLRLQGGGYFAACAMLVDDDFVLCTGPAAVSTSALVARSVPFRLVAPAIGSVRPDLQRKAPGIYLVSDGETVGPLGIRDVEKRLGKSLNLN